jgi:hypothetical protein
MSSRRIRLIKFVSVVIVCVILSPVVTILWLNFILGEDIPITFETWLRVDQQVGPIIGGTSPLLEK